MEGTQLQAVLRSSAMLCCLAYVNLHGGISVPPQSMPLGPAEGQSAVEACGTCFMQLKHVVQVQTVSGETPNAA